MSPLRRLAALAADAGVRATATTRIIALIGAPVSIYLVATHVAPRIQGYYFVAVNVIALAQLFEIGLATIVVQFASHEWPRLRWGKSGGLDGDPVAVAAVHAVLRAAVRWYAAAALILLAIAGVGGGLLLGSSYADSARGFTMPWCGFVALVALYLLIVPFVAVAEGCGELVAVQRMRSCQGVALLAALWTGILTSGPLTAALLGAAAQLLVSVAWLLWRHAALLLSPRPVPGNMTDAARALATGFRKQQLRSAQLWLALWIAPQLLTPIALKLHGGDAAGRLGVTFAIAFAPLTLAVAWLHGRYPSFGALVSEGRTPEFDALARRAAGEAVVVFVAAAAMLTGAVLLLPLLLPSVAARVLPLPSLLALLGGGLAALLLQAMAGWLRAFRDDKIAGPIVGGAVITVLVSGVAAAFGSVLLMTAAFAIASLGIAVPIAAAHFIRVRRERLGD
ncbi:MAG TPA: hypothetical protein VHE78_18665 [Gemmatimonadaceae bacterium]|nr:hypothetical protein [Gemmatimonadaceae bacterium]